MDFSQLHFSNPLWLWAGLVIPLVWGIYFLFFTKNSPLHYLEQFIDSHLLPHLLINQSKKKSSVWIPLALWTISWVFLTLALAGPRWDFREVETFSKDQSLVILLDLSKSMNAMDVKPSRLERAKQKIEDILNLAKGVKVGLIAFAADPHMIFPLTDDLEAIRHFLPTLDTDLVHVQGSRISGAFDMASKILDAEPGNNKAILVISDGGFEDASALLTAKRLSEKGMIIHTMGVGTVDGSPIKDIQGNVAKKNGIPIVSRLEKERFSQISEIGKGHYLEADYSDDGVKMILNELQEKTEEQIVLGKKNKIWGERFYLLVFPVIPIFLWWFKKGNLFVLLILFLPIFNVSADVSEYFRNKDQQAEHFFNAGDYKSATELFEDPYRKGVAYYRAGEFAEAEKMFRLSSKEDVASSAAYNLGNSLAQQQKLKEAVTVYEDLLKKWPEHTKAKENLELIKELLKQEQNPEQEKKKDPNSQSEDNNEGDQSDSENENSKNQNKEDKEKKEKSESKKNQENKDQNSQNQDENSEGQEKNSEEDSSEKNDDKDQAQDQNQDTPEKNDQETPSENSETPNENPDKSPESAENESSEDSKEAKQETVDSSEDSKNEDEQNADMWLNRINSDPKQFMKNKFYIESKKSGAVEAIDPW